MFAALGSERILRFFPSLIPFSSVQYTYLQINRGRIAIGLGHEFRCQIISTQFMATLQTDCSILDKMQDSIFRGFVGEHTAPIADNIS